MDSGFKLMDDSNADVLLELVAKDIEAKIIVPFHLLRGVNFRNI